MTVRLVVVGLMAAVAGARASAQGGDCSAKTCAYWNTALVPEVRAKDLVSRMTLEEKVSQTLDHAKAIPRLGVAEYNWWNEGLHGVARSGFATVFPQAIGMAATWDAGLMREEGDVVATEARAKHNLAVKAGKFSRYTGLTYWSPNINIFRDPRWGRGQETYGEDPVLTATMGVAFIRGLQGDDAKEFKVVATPKHFAVHSGPEPGRHGFDVKPSAFDLEDTYLPAFRAAITEGNADSIMCAYNALYGDPACASKLLLQDKLRGAWGFKGFVVSDCDAVGDEVAGHHFAADNAHAAAVSVLAGDDLDCGNAYAGLTEAVQKKLLPESALDEAVVRLMTARIKLGMFDAGHVGAYEKLGASDVGSAEHRALALRAARESVVLLVNKGATLPLARGTKIAVVGPTAELIQANEGNYNGVSVDPVLGLEGMRKEFGAENVSYSAGSILAEGMFTAVPSSAFGPGLKAEYFSGLGFHGKAAVERVDARLNFDWDGAVPSPELAGKFSAVWTGTLDLPAAGKYRLRFRGVPRARKTDVTGEGAAAVANDDRVVRVLMDGKVVIDSAAGNGETEFAAARGPHALRIEYNRTSNERMVGLEWIPPAGALVEDAVVKAAAADVVVAFVGLSPDLEGEEMSVKVPGFAGGDRTELGLPGPQEELLKAVKKTGKPLVVVLTSGSAIAANWAAENADAMVEAWYGGESAGTAIAETLAGVNNPSGKLPLTFYRDVKDLPAFTDYSMKGRTYRYFGGKALFGFGYGLSYTTFAVSDVSVGKGEVAAGEAVSVSATVRNAGKVAGDEVVEVYVSAPGEAKGAKPALAGFARVHLGVGESKVVTVSLDARKLSRVDEKGKRVEREGTYTVWVGDSQPVGTGVELVVKGSVGMPE